MMYAQIGIMKNPWEWSSELDQVSINLLQTGKKARTKFPNSTASRIMCLTERGEGLLELIGLLGFIGLLEFTPAQSREQGAKSPKLSVVRCQ